MKKIEEWFQPEYNDISKTKQEIEAITYDWLYDFILEPELLSIVGYKYNDTVWLEIIPPAGFRVNTLENKIYINFPNNNAREILKFILSIIKQQ